jgi:hypothetical protein
MDTIGGFVQIVPAHAMVMMLAFPSRSATLTMTAGTGFNILPGFHVCLDICIYSFCKKFHACEFAHSIGNADSQAISFVL